MRTKKVAVVRREGSQKMIGRIEKRHDALSVAARAGERNSGLSVVDVRRLLPAMIGK